MNIKRQALFWGSFFLAIVGFVLHIHQMFTMAAALACLPLIALLLGRHKLQGLQVSRKSPSAVSAGEAVTVELEVSNSARTRRIFFFVSEHVPPALQPEGRFDLPVAILGPGEQTHLSYRVLPPRRGVYPLGPSRLLAPDAIGLRQYARDLPEIHELLVYPRPLLLPYLWPEGAGGKQPVKPRRRLRGQGEDLYGLREYVPGDDPRRIAWKATARRGKLLLAEREHPESLEAMVVLDLDRRWHGGEGDQHSLEYAVTLAATLLDQAYERGSTVGLLAVGVQAFAYSPMPEEVQRQRLLEALARLAPDAGEPLSETVSRYLSFLPARCSVAVISPSAEAGPVALRLRGLDHPVAWFVLDAGSFDRRLHADYSELSAALARSRCRVQRVRGDLPLAANWRRGLGGGSHAAG